MKCKRCNSYAINHHNHGRDGSGEELCDVCYWRTIAETRLQKIKQLEDRIHRASMAFFRDGSDGQVASGMLAILEEERRKQ